MTTNVFDPLDVRAADVDPVQLVEPRREGDLVDLHVDVEVQRVGVIAQLLQQLAEHRRANAVPVVRRIDRLVEMAGLKDALPLNSQSPLNDYESYVVFY